MKIPAFSDRPAFSSNCRLPFAAVAAAALSLVPLAGRALAEPPASSSAAVTEMPTASKDVLVVKESKGTLTLNPEGKDVSIIGSHNKVTIKGKCHALTVNGMDNVVSVEAVATISLPGTDSHVTWESAVGGEKPQVTDTGKGNTAKQKVK